MVLEICSLLGFLHENVKKDEMSSVVEQLVEHVDYSLPSYC